MHGQQQEGETEAGEPVNAGSSRFDRFQIPVNAGTVPAVDFPSLPFRLGRGSGKPNNAKQIRYGSATQYAHAPC